MFDRPISELKALTGMARACWEVQLLSSAVPRIYLLQYMDEWRPGMPDLTPYELWDFRRRYHPRARGRESCRHPLPWQARMIIAARDREDGEEWLDRIRDRELEAMRAQPWRHFDRIKKLQKRRASRQAEIERERQAGGRDPRRTFTPSQKKRLFEQANGCCTYCGDELGPDWEADHVVPWSRGGRTTLDNGAAACHECNRLKYSMTGDEFQARLAAREGTLL